MHRLSVTRDIRRLIGDRPVMRGTRAIRQPVNDNRAVVGPAGGRVHRVLALDHDIGGIAIVRRRTAVVDPERVVTGARGHGGDVPATALPAHFDDVAGLQQRPPVAGLLAAIENDLPLAVAGDLGGVEPRAFFGQRGAGGGGDIAGQHPAAAIVPNLADEGLGDRRHFRRRRLVRRRIDIVGAGDEIHVSGVGPAGVEPAVPIGGVGGVAGINAEIGAAILLIRARELE